ncbi:MAG: squalene synthase HpnC [Betaproteobacteria bacterium]|nr:squalene synthase HpnC [Betaproteobacteria bacterium]
MPQHYENFPVASVLLPKRLRHPVSVIYSFARAADDFADEGDLEDATRLSLLGNFRSELDGIDAGITPATPLFVDLAEVVARHRLPLQPFYDLLDAFSQDVTVKRYANLGELMNYCQRSANPVGLLLLHLYDAASERNISYSNAICSSLQLINFLQDVAIDYHDKDRIYLPQDELAKYRITEAQIARGDCGGLWQPFMQFQIERTRKLLQSGAPLGNILRGRIGLEMRMIVMGGETILRKLHKSGGDVFNNRPILKSGDWAYMLYRALRKK